MEPTQLDLTTLPAVLSTVTYAVVLCIVIFILCCHQAGYEYYVFLFNSQKCNPEYSKVSLLHINLLTTPLFAVIFINTGEQKSTQIRSPRVNT